MLCFIRTYWSSVALRSLLLLPLIALVHLSTPSFAAACSFAAPDEHQLDDDEVAVDTVAPGTVGRVELSVKRGHGPEGCASRMDDSCSDIGVLEITFDPATDDRTDADQMGYLVEVTGDLPNGFNQLVSAIRAPFGRILLTWIDGATDDQESFDISVTLTAVDLAGNSGPASVAAGVARGGGDSACSIAGRAVGAPGDGWVVALVVVGLIARAGRTRAGRI